MKGKHKTFWSFFWRVFAGYLAFCVAAMAGFTYLAAAQKREADAWTMSNRATSVAQQMEQIRQTEKYTDEERMGKLINEMLSEKYYAYPNLKVELALYGEEDKPLLAATENYWNILEGYVSRPADYFIDIDRWLTKEEQQTICQMMIDDWNMDMWGTYEIGDTIYNFMVDGWLDGQMIIPHKIYKDNMRITHVSENGWSAEELNDKPVLFTFQPEGVKTDGLPYKTEMLGTSSLLNGLSNRGSGSPEISYQEFIAYQNDPDRVALRESLYAAGPEIEAMYQPILQTGTMNGLWKLQLIFKHEVSDRTSERALRGRERDDPYTVVYGAVSYPLKTAVKQLVPVYGLCFVMVLVLSALLAWRLNRVWQKQEKLEQVRRDTTNALAHELKTPLAVLSASAELLQSDLAADKRTHYLSVIQEQAARMDGSVKKMLDLSRLEAGAEQLRREPLSLAALAEDMLYAAAPLTEGMETRIVSDGADEALVDRTLLTRALDSLLGNAVRFTPVGGRITVHIENGVCAVENTGEPIGEDILPRLWDAYYQGDPARTDEGTGLGLAIAKAVFELHGYPFGAENGADGPRFWFRFEK